MRGASIRLDSLSGAFALCDLDGTILDANSTGAEVLAWMDMSKRVALPLWANLDGVEAGDEVVYQVPHSTRTVICLRFAVGTDRELLLMREIAPDREPLSRHSERHRARTTETLFYFLVHDLRTLLAAISFNLKTMDDCTHSGDITTLSRCVDDCESAVAELQVTVDTLVDLARSGRSPSGELDVQSVVDRTVRLTRPLFRQAGHELIVTIDPATPAMYANGVAIQQILMNLLVNAVESSTQPIAVELTAAAATLATSTGTITAVRIRVSDHGPGVPPDVQPRLFQPFFTTKSSGAGLGLVLSRNAAREQGGTLEFIPGSDGACFELIVPCPASD